MLRTEPQLSPRFSANSSTVTCQSSRINSSKFSSSPSLDVVSGMPGRWSMFSHFWKSPPHYTNFFGRDNCHSNEEGRFLRLINSVFTRSDQKIWHQHSVFLWCTALIEPPCWKETFPLIARDSLMSNLTAGVPKLRLTF